MKSLLLTSCVLLVTLAAVPWQASAQQGPVKRDEAKAQQPRVRYLTPHPPYPFQALQRHLEGVCTVRVQFDAQGNVSSAMIVKSSGSEILDSNAANWIKKEWKSLEGRPSVYTKDLVYSLSRRSVG